MGKLLIETARKQKKGEKNKCLTTTNAAFKSKKCNDTLRDERSNSSVSLFGAGKYL